MIISCHWNINDRERDIPHPETQGKGFCFSEILTDCETAPKYPNCLPCKKDFFAIYCVGVNKSNNVVQWAVKCCCQEFAVCLPLCQRPTQKVVRIEWTMDLVSQKNTNAYHLSPWNKSSSPTSLEFNLSFWGEGARREWGAMDSMFAGELQIAVATFRCSYCHWASLSLLEP